MSEETIVETGSEVTAEDTEPTSTELESITVADLHTMTSDIVHANLFGAFLICGTLVGVALFGRLFK